jgi:Ca2+-dependent lipid-binding protein
MPTGTLEVIIVEGRRLKDKDAVGQSDPFVEIYTQKKYKQRTTTIQNTSDPVWNERFLFNIHPDDDTIHFDVYDSDVAGKDSIGNGKVKLKNVFDDGQFEDWVKLPAHFGLSVHGEIHVIMKFTVSFLRRISDISH